MLRYIQRVLRAPIAYIHVFDNWRDEAEESWHYASAASASCGAEWGIRDLRKLPLWTAPETPASSYDFSGSILVISYLLIFFEMDSVS